MYKLQFTGNVHKFLVEDADITDCPYYKKNFGNLSKFLSNAEIRQYGKSYKATVKVDKTLAVFFAKYCEYESLMMFNRYAKDTSLGLALDRASREIAKKLKKR